MSGNKDTSAKKGFGSYASVYVVGGIVIAMGCLWLFSEVISFFTGTPEEKSSYEQVMEGNPYLQKADRFIEGLTVHEAHVSNSAVLSTAEESIADSGANSGPMKHNEAAGHDELAADVNHPDVAQRTVANTHTTKPVERESSRGGGHGGESYMTNKVIGVAFVDGLVEPLERELNSFWGWRPNDMMITKLGRDNVENYQLGIWEVSRRTAVILAERIARTGSNVSFNKYLNDAANRLTRSPDSFWFPSAESEYKGAIKNLNKYKDQLLTGEESFYTRPDNLIPLLVEFRTRLGDCDDKLVRKENDPESQVSTFAADDRFYYAQGVASAILPLLEAIQQDFSITLETRGGMEILHQAIESLKEADHLSPWFVMEGAYDGFLANHRANMATFISHARFYIGVLIITLST